MFHGMQEASKGNVPLVSRVVVSLRAGFVLALANILCVGVLSWAYLRAKAEPKVISVTGSAKKAIVSDLVDWKVHVMASDPALPDAYAKLKEATDRTVAFLQREGIPASELTVSSISTSKQYTKDAKGNSTRQVEAYELKQAVQITSRDVRKVMDIERKITELMRDGVLLESESPSLLYTKLAELKVVMLAEATKDATVRAQQIAANSGATLGSVREARMGVMQINAMHSNDVSSSGVNDTRSYEKEITAVVSTKFALE